MLKFLLYPLYLSCLFYLFYSDFVFYQNPVEHRHWIQLLFKFLNKVANVVLVCVTNYFITFNICYTATLNALVTMIDNYFNLLATLINHFTEYPAILFLSIDVFICMAGAVLIIGVVFTRWLPHFVSKVQD